MVKFQELLKIVAEMNARAGGEGRWVESAAEGRHAAVAGGRRHAWCAEEVAFPCQGIGPFLSAARAAFTLPARAPAVAIRLRVRRGTHGVSHVAPSFRQGSRNRRCWHRPSRTFPTGGPGIPAAIPCRPCRYPALPRDVRPWSLHRRESAFQARHGLDGGARRHPETPVTPVPRGRRFERYLQPQRSRGPRR
jgi:hypothetical protein